MQNILLLNGPNLNMLGKREPHIYGDQTLLEIEQRLKQQAIKQGYNLLCFQANGEEAIINRIHQAFGNIDFIIINPAAFTHTSIAIRDALLAIAIPFIEVHLSNICSRESFRHHSYFSDISQGIICGLGPKGYDYALDFAISSLK
ncbi:3-dehydroquinate dehydratase [[Haemophilus] ducreyi]|uniref:type II 3-dehydroquinate dehydratase n=1 Tax=Haemophilus ducreyi TaxID=730 RepID=UPI0007CDC4A1|nr:type II 3-dehydroquinate dehydratase [[Haemophilus] ducreyi]ANF71201.1 3-dehydroquinate dehydratase [[Haemophilus] ducreyi]ANF71617.1 3-dehydroquinate dehydratase [[Haemophilus] ducreyi]